MVARVARRHAYAWIPLTLAFACHVVVQALHKLPSARGIEMPGAG